MGIAIPGAACGTFGSPHTCTRRQHRPSLNGQNKKGCVTLVGLSYSLFRPYCERVHRWVTTHSARSVQCGLPPCRFGNRGNRKLPLSHSKAEERTFSLVMLSRPLSPGYAKRCTVALQNFAQPEDAVVALCP